MFVCHCYYCAHDQIVKNLKVKNIKHGNEENDFTENDLLIAYTPRLIKARYVCHPIKGRRDPITGRCEVGVVGK